MVTPHLTSASFVVLALLAGFLAPDMARAQTPAPSATPVTSRPAGLLLPRLMVGFGIGSSNDVEGLADARLQTASVHYLLGREFVVAGEVSHWARSWNDRFPGRQIIGPQGQVGFSGDELSYGEHRTWAVGSNFLYRSYPRRVSWFAGGGPALEHHSGGWTRRTEGCVAPGFDSRCSSPQGVSSDTRGTRAAFQGLLGVDVQIVGSVRAYADLRFTTMDESLLQMSTGVRVVTRTRRADAEAERRGSRIGRAQAAAASPASTPPGRELPALAGAAPGKGVRVWLANGARAGGRFVSLDATELSVRDEGRDVRYPLDQVLVEAAHHKARNAAIGGAIAGFFVGWIGSCGGGDEGDCWPEAGLLLGGISAGAGAIIGAVIDRSNAPKHVIYVAPARSPSVRLAPVVSPKMAGVAVALRW